METEAIVVDKRSTTARTKTRNSDDNDRNSNKGRRTAAQLLLLDDRLANHHEERRVVLLRHIPFPDDNRIAQARPDKCAATSETLQTPPNAMRSPFCAFPLARGVDGRTVPGDQPSLGRKAARLCRSRALTCPSQNNKGVLIPLPLALVFVLWGCLARGGMVFCGVFMGTGHEPCQCHGSDSSPACEGSSRGPMFDGHERLPVLRFFAATGYRGGRIRASDKVFLLEKARVHIRQAHIIAILGRSVRQTVKPFSHHVVFLQVPRHVCAVVGLL